VSALQPTGSSARLHACESGPFFTPPSLPHPAMHYLLFYEVVPDYVTRRTEYRALHLEHARTAQARGDLILAGALADPVDGAVLLFSGSSPEVAAGFARADPYVLNGLVTRWYVREWTTVVGEGAAVRLPPDA
jgi:uncharacterized protein